MKFRVALAALGALAGGLSVYAQNATPLSELLAEAAQNNPDILTAEHTWRAATHVRQQVTTLPNPQFTLQEFSVGSPKPLAGLSTSNFAYVGIGAAQELPYPGKLSRKGEAADRAADVQKAQIAAIQASVADQIKAAYLRLAYLQQTLTLLESSRATVGQLIESELLRYRSGGGSQANVLKAQLQRTRLVREVTMRHSEMAQTQAELKRLAHRSQDSPEITAEDLKMTALHYSSRELLDWARRQNPEVTLSASSVVKQNAELRSAERAGKPDFSVGYMFQRTGTDFPAYYMLTFNVIFQRRQRVKAERAQALESVQSAQAQFDARLQQQLAEVQKQYAAAEGAAEELTEYREGMIPQADAGFQSILSQYQSNRQQLDSVLTSFNDVLELKREYAQALLDYEMALARLETLTGVTLR